MNDDLLLHVLCQHTTVDDLTQINYSISKDFYTATLIA